MDENRHQNVLMVHNLYKIPGGEDTVVKNETRVLTEHGHKVILYTRNNNELDTMPKAKKLLLPFTTIFNFKTYTEVKKIIRRENIDIVHVHNTLNLISPAVYYAAKTCKVPVVQHIHNFRLICPGAMLYRDGKICEECLTKGLHPAVKHKCYRNSRLQTLACVISSRLYRMLKLYRDLYYICLTDFNCEMLLNLKQIPREHVFVKPNFSYTPGEITLTEKREGYVFAGRVEELKGIKVLLEAWRILGDRAPKLSVIGKGEYLDQAESFAKEHRLNMEFKGFVPNEEAIKLIGGARMLIMPTQWYEGFPMTIVEAFSVGTPVLVSDLGNAGDLVTAGRTGLKFRYDDPASLADAVLKAEEAAFDAEAIRGEWAEHYSEETNYQQLKKIYDSIS